MSKIFTQIFFVALYPESRECENNKYMNRLNLMTIETNIIENHKFIKYRIIKCINCIKNSIHFVIHILVA